MMGDGSASWPPRQARVIAEAASSRVPARRDKSLVLSEKGAGQVVALLVGKQGAHDHGGVDVDHRSVASSVEGGDDRLGTLMTADSFREGDRVGLQLVNGGARRGGGFPKDAGSSGPF